MALDCVTQGEIGVVVEGAIATGLERWNGRGAKYVPP